MVAAVVSLLAGNAHALPSGGQLAFGAGTVSQAGSAMTVRQDSQNLGLNWQSFGIGSNESVTFVQPNASSIALNRVLGSDPSAIYGRLSANGQVWLLNPNGVLFGSGAQVNVGGLVASSLNLSDGDFLAGKRTFSGNGGLVSNSGALTAADGGYVALLGGRVSNEGVIQARLGTVALAAGKQVTLDFAGDRLVNLQVDQGAVDALVENKQLIRADGGLALMTAQGADAVLDAVVNNQGVIEAQTVDTSTGVIRLLGGRNGGTVNVAGTLDASAPGAGNGGFIETSGYRVKVADEAQITTASANGASGTSGTWLIDPTNFTIAANGGDITGAALADRLASNNVTILSSQGSTSGLGDIRVNDSVTWSAANSLTLSALHDVRVARPITSNGSGALTLRADNTGACVAGAVNCGTVSFVGQGHVTLNGGALNIYYSPKGSNLSADANGNGPSYATPTDYSSDVTLRNGSTLTAWMLVNDVNQLQAINTNLSGTYALGRDIDASATAAWNPSIYPDEPNAGFLPIGDSAHPFTGALDGQGHVITDLVMNGRSPETSGEVTHTYFGLFDSTTGLLENLGLIDSSVTGSRANTYVGTLAGYNGGTIRNVFVEGDVSSPRESGGLVGYNTGTITHASVSGSVFGLNDAGGLVEYNAGVLTDVHSAASVNAQEDGAISGGLVAVNAGTIRDADASGGVTSYATAGGLVGRNTGTIHNAFASGDVSGYKGPVGGLVGDNSGAICHVRASGNVTGSRTNSGGLVGLNSGTIGFASASGAVTAASLAADSGNNGGLVGYNSGTISDSYASGRVLLGIPEGIASYDAGLVGYNVGTIRNSYATGDVSGGQVNGGLVGFNSGLIRNSYASGDVVGANDVGGLVGINRGTIDGSYATGDVTGRFVVGGLVGDNVGEAAVISNSYATGNVTGDFDVGGLVGHNAGRIENSYATGNVTDLARGIAHDTLGGLVGANDGTIARSYAKGNVLGWFNAGGLVGVNNGSISGSHASGNAGADGVGGLVGRNAGAISDSYATGSASGDLAGGLVGVNIGSIVRSYASGNASAGRYGGGLAGTNDGLVLDSHATGRVSGGDYLGGLVGTNNGTIARSYATGRVSTASGYFVGGLVGENEKVITDTYATGSVRGYADVGGLVGFNRTGGTISASYSTGAVSGQMAVGGLVGLNEGIITNGYWDVQTSGTTVGVGSGSASGATGLTEEQMKRKASFVGFDFSNVWDIIEGSTYPFLR